MHAQVQCAQVMLGVLNSKSQREANEHVPVHVAQGLSCQALWAVVRDRLRQLRVVA